MADMSENIFSLFGVLALTAAMGLVPIVLALWLFSWTKWSSWLSRIVALAAGGLIGEVFFHILPEIDGRGVFWAPVVGFMLFLAVEKWLTWHHCHRPDCEEENVSHLPWLVNLGDTIHNLIDGLVIGSAFGINWGLGMATVTAIFFHEIPQEIGDIGLMMHGGWSRSRILWANILSSSLSLVGVLIGWFLGGGGGGVEKIVLGVAAGGFLYLAASDLIPEMKKHDHNGWEGGWQMIGLTLGLLIMWALTFVE